MVIGIQRPVEGSKAVYSLVFKYIDDATVKVGRNEAATLKANGIHTDGIDPLELQLRFEVYDASHHLVATSATSSQSLPMGEAIKYEGAVTLPDSVKDGTYEARLAAHIQDVDEDGVFKLINYMIGEYGYYEVTVKDGTVTYTGSQYTVSQGVDVSDWQNEIRWQEVAQSGIDFSVIRCGYRSYGIGELRIDPRFEENYAGAGAAGLRRGVYFFSQATTVEEAREEAAYVLQSLDGRPLELPVFYDWETVTAPEGRANALDGETVTACAAAFCQAIEAAGYTAGLYFNLQQGYHTYDLSPLKSCTLWLAEPGASPTFYYRTALWQYDHSGTVPGIDAAADRNLLFEKKQG